MNPRVFAALTLGLVACTMPGPTRPEAQMSLKKRASFDLHCGKQEVELQQLAGTCGQNEWSGCQYGASCGDNRAVYVYYGNNTWLLNSESSAQQK